jgi:hypothetical protein
LPFAHIQSVSRHPLPFAHHASRDRLLSSFKAHFKPPLPEVYSLGIQGFSARQQPVRCFGFSFDHSKMDAQRLPIVLPLA